jgi:glucose-1-phosphate thymidylyltransferase
MMQDRKGIILAGGTGSRLHPITLGTSKQLLPIYDKPMIYYPLSVLMLSGIKNILLISTPQDIDAYKNILGNGKQLGINIKYEIQKKPNGLAEAFILGESFIGNSKVTLILGDNLFYGQHFSEKLMNASETSSGATIFGFQVKNPDQFGVVDFNKNGEVLSIEEKPAHPKSNYAVTGLYFYDNDVVEFAKSIKPSPRGELEITDINNIYLKNNKLSIELLGRGFSWLDTGTYDALLDAGNYVKSIQSSQGFMVGCVEEIAFNKGWISRDELISISKRYKTNYGKYLQNLSGI